MSADTVALSTQFAGSLLESLTPRRHYWLLVAIPLMVLPLKAWSLPIGVSDPVELPLGVDTEVVLRVDGISSLRTVAALEFRIPTNVAGYEVVGGAIHPDLPFAEMLCSTARFRPGEDDFFLSLLIINPSLELTEPLDIAVLTLRGLVPGTEVALKPASVIASGDRDLGDWPLGGIVIARVGNQGPSELGDGYSSSRATLTVTLRDRSRSCSACSTGISNNIDGFIVQTPEPGPFALVALAVGVLLVGRAVRRRRVAID